MTLQKMEKLMVIPATLSPPPNTPTVVINVVLYCFLIFISLNVARKDLQRLSSVPRFIIFASVLRIAWFVSEHAGWGESAGCNDAKGLVSFAGRLSLVLFLGAFSSVLFFWWDVVRTKQDGSVPEGSTFRYFEPTTADILFKFWAFVVMAGLFGYKFFTCDDDARERVSDAEILAIAFFYGVLAIGFASVGSGLYVRLGYRESVSTSQLRFRILLITITSVLFFFFRSALFLMFPVFAIQLKGTVRDILYPWFFYTVPEIVPSLVLLTLLMRRRKVSISLEDALLIAPTQQSDDNLRVFRV